MKKTLSLHRILALCVLLLATSATQAATFYWNGTTGNWETLANWSTDLAGTTPAVSVPLATVSDALNFNTTPGSALTSTLFLNGSRGNSTILGTMNFSATGATTLLGGASGSPANQNLFSSHITVNPGSGAVTIGDTAVSPTAKVDLKAGSSTFTNNSTSLLTLANGLNSYGTGSTTAFTFAGSGNTTASGVIGNGGGTNVVTLTKTGAGTLMLSGVNTYNGSTTVSGGTLKVATGGVINNTNGTGGTGLISGGATLLIDGGTVKFNQTAAGNNTLVLGGTAGQGSGNVTVTNNGVLNVNTGRLILGGASADPGSGTSVFTQDSGTTTVASNLYTGNYRASDINISGGSFTVGGSTILSQRGNTNFNVSGTANVTFNAGVTLGGQSGTYTSNITMSGGTVTAPTVTLGAGNNTVSAAINLNGGTLTVNNIANGANGTTTFNFNGGTLKARQDNGAFLVADTAAIGNGGATIDTNAFNVTIGQTLTRLSGATTDSLTKTGGGVLTLTSNNTYGGGTTISGGTLLLSGATSLPSSGTLQVNPGGTFSLADGTARNTTAPALTLASGSSLALDWNAGAVDTLTSTAAASTNGTVGIIINPTSPTGNGTLVSSAGGGLSGATYFLANNTNFTATLGQSDTALTIDSYSSVPSPATALYWKGGLSGATGTMAYSNGAASNWTSDAGGTTVVGYVPGASTNVTFSGTGATQQSSVTLGADMSLNSLTIDDSSAVSIAGGGKRLTLLSTSLAQGSSAITVTAAAADPTISASIYLGASQGWNIASGKNLTVSGVIEGSNGLTKLDAGNLTLTGANTYTGTTTINSGVLIANTIADTGGSSIGLSALAGALTFGSSNGTLNFTGATGSTTRAITYNGQGTFDIAGGSTLTVGATGTGAATATSGAWSGNGTIVKTGNGTLTVRNNSTARAGGIVLNSITGGALTVQAGTLNISPENTGGSAHAAIGDSAGNTGVLNQTGGSVNFAPLNANASNFFYVGITSNGTLNVTGGTFTANSTQSGGIQVARAAAGNVSIGGGSGAALVDTPKVSFFGTTGGAGSLNLFANGTLLTSELTRTTTGGNHTINFDGGTLKAKSSSGALFMPFFDNVTATISSNGLTVDTNSFDVTIAQPLAGSGGNLTKVSAGNLTLSGANTFTGTTTVTAGTLIISSTGNITSSASTVNGGTLKVNGLAGDVTVNSTGTLSGNGTVGAVIVNTGGTLAPGNSPGILSASSVSLNGTTNMELAGNGGVAGTDFDQVVSTGATTYGGALNILSFGGYDITQTASYDLFNFGSQSGDFATVTVGVTGLTLNTGVWTGTDISGNSYSFSQIDGTLAVVAVPEPGTWILVGIGLAFLLYRKPRRRLEP